LHLGQHRGDRRRGETALVFERLVDFRDGRLAARPQHAQDRELQVTELLGRFHGRFLQVNYRDSTTVVVDVKPPPSPPRAPSPTHPPPPPGERGTPPPRTSSHPSRIPEITPGSGRGSRSAPRSLPRRSPRPVGALLPPVD